MPDRVVKRVNKWGSTKRGEKYLVRFEFLNPKYQPFEWENEEIGDTLPEKEESIYPNILAEIPGVVPESDFEDIGDAVTTPSPPSLVDRVVAILLNANLSTRT